jgi:hypothetical protein
MKELLVLIREVAFSKKVTLKKGLFQQAERLVGVYTWLHQKQKKKKPHQQLALVISYIYL